jgi:hypothetical protein
MKSTRLTEWLPSLLATLLGVVLAFIARGNLALLAAVPFAAAPVLLAWPTRHWSGPWAYLVLYAAGIAEFMLFGRVIESALPHYQPSFGDGALVLSAFSVSAILSFVLRLRLATDRLMVSIGEKITILLIVSMTYLPINILVLYAELAP